MLCYSIVEQRFLNIDSRATPKTKVRPVRHCMHGCEVGYKDVFKGLAVKNSI